MHGAPVLERRKPRFCKRLRFRDNGRIMRFLPRFELSATHLLATALAAITATVAASYLGVAGTVIGAAVVSVMSAIGNAVYAHSLRSTHARVREVVPARRRTPDASPAQGRSGGTAAAAREDNVAVPRGRWQRVAFGAVAVFVALLTLVTSVELVTGRPLSDLVRGDTGAGTSVFGDATGNSRPVPTVTRTVVPAVQVVTPTVTRTAPAVTQTATPTVTDTPSAPSPPSSTPTTPGHSDQPTP